MTGGRTRRVAVLLAVVAALLVIPGSFAADFDSTPMLQIGTDHHLLNQAADVYFDTFHLDVPSVPERIVMTTPAAYGVSLVHPVASELGDAYIGTVTKQGGPITDFEGALTVMDPVAYGASASAQACAPGAHTAVWELNVKSKAGTALAVPLAIDPTPGQPGSYQFTACFDDEHAQGLIVSEMYFDVSDTFRTPAQVGRYTFGGMVTPFAADATPNTAQVYELRGYEDVPQVLTAKPMWVANVQTLAVAGVLTAKGIPRSGIHVEVYAGKSPLSMKQIGDAYTDDHGRYIYTQEYVTPPAWVYTHVSHYWGTPCSGGSPAPAGCASYTVDGRTSQLALVPRPKPKKKPTPHKK